MQDYKFVPTAQLRRCSYLPYQYFYWQVEYLVNRLIAIVGVTLIRQKAVAGIHMKAIKLYWRHLNLTDRKKSPNHQIKIIAK